MYWNTKNKIAEQLFYFLVKIRDLRFLLFPSNFDSSKTILFATEKTDVSQWRRNNLPKKNIL